MAHADGILAQLDAAEAEVAAIAGLRGGQPAMASFPTAGATIMPLADRDLPRPPTRRST